jgi:hypothetical protein
MERSAQRVDLGQGHDHEGGLSVRETCAEKGDGGLHELAVLLVQQHPMSEAMWGGRVGRSNRLAAG